LYEIFGREASAEFIAEDGPRENIIAKCLAPLPESSKDLANIEERLGPRSSKLPINEIHDFNQLSRNRWVAGRAAEVPHGSKVLDVGAGTCLYQRLFSHCIYVSQDFQDYDGFRNNKEGSYGHIDIRSDITSIPVEDSSFDVVLCTEVLEHVPEPILALKELVRIVRPGGRLLLTAPLGSGLHQLPFYFYGGFSPEWYKKFLGDFGCESISISSNGGYFKLLAQECARFKWTMDQHRTFHGEDAELLERLFGEILPRYLFTMDDAFQNHQFTVGYHVSALKKL
jgi:SAM-dependent methyltransferase